MRRHDDAVGEVRVATGGGTEVIDQIGESTIVTDYAVAPTPRAPLDDALFNDVFGSALDFLPRRAGRFGVERTRKHRRSGRRNPVRPGIG